MDVAILGASGDCGREIAGQLVASRVLAPTERLQLVGRANGASARVLHGMVSDLTDAHAEYVPDLDVALTPNDVVADLWVVACGHTPPTSGQHVDRSSLAQSNGAIFSSYADALRENGHGSEIVVVVSNPVELGVALFARAIGRERVVGIGAYQDALRFRREIASDLGVRRQRVGGFMIGEHGDAQVPIWSSVSVVGMDKSSIGPTLLSLRRGTEGQDFAQLCQTERASLKELITQGEIAEAFRRVDALPPDVRVVLKPFITHLSGAKTVMATANVTVDLVRTLLDGHDALVAGQVVLEGDWHGLSGPLGVPVIASASQGMRPVEISLTDREREQVGRVSQEITNKVTGWINGMEGAATA